MKKYYNNTKYDTAFDRWTGIVSELMMKYGPHVLSRQRLQKSVDKGKVDILPEGKLFLVLSGFLHIIEESLRHQNLSMSYKTTPAKDALRKHCTSDMMHATHNYQ